MQRRGKSDAGISGTNDISHLPNEYSNTQFDGRHIKLNYNAKQPKPSPVLMPALDVAQAKISRAQFFLGYMDIPQSLAPCFSGGRMETYDTSLSESKWIKIV